MCNEFKAHTPCCTACQRAVLKRKLAAAGIPAALHVRVAAGVTIKSVHLPSPSSQVIAAFGECWPLEECVHSPCIATNSAAGART